MTRRLDTKVGHKGGESTAELALTAKSWWHMTRRKESLLSLRFSKLVSHCCKVASKDSDTNQCGSNAAKSRNSTHFSHQECCAPHPPQRSLAPLRTKRRSPLNLLQSSVVQFCSYNSCWRCWLCWRAMRNIRSSFESRPAFCIKRFCFFDSDFKVRHRLGLSAESSSRKKEVLTVLTAFCSLHPRLLETKIVDPVYSMG